MTFIANPKTNRDIEINITIINEVLISSKQYSKRAVAIANIDIINDKLLAFL